MKIISWSENNTNTFISEISLKQMPAEKITFFFFFTLNQIFYEKKEDLKISRNSLEKSRIHTASFQEAVFKMHKNTSA